MSEYRIQNYYVVGITLADNEIYQYQDWHEVHQDEYEETFSSVSLCSDYIEACASDKMLAWTELIQACLSTMIRAGIVLETVTNKHKEILEGERTSERSADIS